MKNLIMKRKWYKTGLASALFLVPFIGYAEIGTKAYGQFGPGPVTDPAHVEAFYWLVGFAVLQVISIMVLSSSLRGMYEVKSKMENDNTSSSKGSGNKIVSAIALLIGTLWTTSAFAAGEPEFLFHVDETHLYMLVFFNSVLLVINIVYMGMVKSRAKDMYPVTLPRKKKYVREKIWVKIYKNLTASVPIEEEEGVLMDHEYDGIQELDNRLPPWWLYGFYVTIVAGALYMAYYHVWGIGDLSAEAYEKEMIQAEIDVQAYLDSRALNVDESSVVMITDKDRLNKGKTVFLKQCMSCHGELGEGGVGPNFTDQYWLYGGDIKDIFSTVKYGKPDKGMKSWRKELTPIQMQEVSSYILSLQGTNPPNAKEPQGSLYVPEEADSDSIPASTEPTDSIP